MLFVLCLVIAVTQTDQKMHTVHIKSQIVHIHVLSYMFQHLVLYFSVTVSPWMSFLLLKHVGELMCVDDL